MIQGYAAFVHPSFRNTRYISIENGDHFGILDIVGTVSQNESIELYEWYSKKHLIKRQFTIQAIIDCEVMTLNIDNLNLMQQEFIS